MTTMNTNRWQPFVPSRAQWKRTALSALLALGVATSSLVTSPANAASPSVGRADATVYDLSNCLEFAASWGVSTGDPCIKIVRWGSDHISLAFSQNDGKEHDWLDSEYHIRWSQLGLPEQTVNTGTFGYFSFGNLKPGTTYRFAAQRCEKVTFGKDRCTGWTVLTVPTKVR
jgi:hypothetical protein